MEHGGDVIPIVRRDKTNARRVALIIHALSDRFTGDPFSAMSDHYVAPPKKLPNPGEIGAVACRPTEVDSVSISNVQHGWNALGEYQ